MTLLTIVVFSLALLAAQDVSDRLPRKSTASLEANLVEPFRQVRERGYVEGRDLGISVGRGPIRLLPERAASSSESRSM